MGSSEQDRMVRDNEKLQHPVELSAFQIARYPTTVAQYGAFVKEGGYAEQ